MLKPTYLAATAAVLLSGPVMAADVVEEPVLFWTGFYVGGGIGGTAWLNIKANSEFCDAVTGECFKDGNLAQLFDDLNESVAWRNVIQTGFDWELTPGIVMGVMGDFNFGEQIGIDRSIRFGGADGDRLRSSFDYGIDNMWTLAGRLGWATENALFYGLFGWTWADTDLQVRHGCREDECITKLNGGEWLDGWTLGGGVEFKGILFESVSTRLEYRYTDLGDTSANGRDILDNRFEVSADQVVQGVYVTSSWRFDPLTW